MESLRKIKAEPITVTMTLGEVDALVNAGHFFLEARGKDISEDEREELFRALQALDVAVNQ